jgi:ABC-type taurine transport system substrate-binding protein
VIVRILGEGQWTVDDSHVEALNVHDAHLTAALDGGDEDGFRSALAALLAEVKESGSQLPDEELVPSDVVLPSAFATVDEVRELLSDDGLIPG